MQFHLNDMTCEGCALAVVKAIQSVDAQAEIQTDPPSRTVTVTSSAPQEAIETVLTEAGFPPAH